MSSSTLESLTNELFEMIVTYLDFQDLCALRLTSRAASHKATQDTFRSKLKTKSIDLTPSGLEQFAYMTSENRLGCLVEDVTLIGMVYNPYFLENLIKFKSNGPSGEDLDPAEAADALEELQRQQRDSDALRIEGNDLKLLTKAFYNLTKSRKILDSLALSFIVYREDASSRLSPVQGKCWKLVFRAAGELFSLVMAALRDSMLSIRAFDVFGEVPQCNVPCDALSRGWEASKPAASFATLRRLAIRFSEPVLDDSEFSALKVDPARKVNFSLIRQKRDPAILRACLGDEANYSSLARLLECCPQLEVLQLSGYSAESYDSERRLQLAMRQKYMYHLGRLPPLRQLREVSLSGFGIDDATDLAAFLKNHCTTLRDLKLREINLIEGKFATILSDLHSEDFTLERIHLEDFWEKGKPVLFSGEQIQPCTEISGAYFARNVIRRWGEDAGKKIDYYRYTGRSVGSPRVSQWSKRRHEEFGRR